MILKQSGQTYICQNYINGNWVPAQSREAFESRNPSDWQELVATAPQSDISDANWKMG